MNQPHLELKPIGILHSPFKEKFGIPRQANLIQSCSAEVELYAPYNDMNSVRGLEAFSDIWLIFSFHQNQDYSWRPLVRPPRLGGNKKIGVFASRAPFRPNNLGLSRVALRGIKQDNGKVRLSIACPDIVDGTPIYDIKPYIHYADSNPQALCGFAPDAPEKKLEVQFSDTALKDLALLNCTAYPNLKTTIIEVLKYDPRPAYKKQSDSQYGFKLYNLNIVWTLDKDQACVETIQLIN
jgi:tRNA-Thr(GGU) m(6)t(6)A37 methyltransferase TsaA